MKNFYKIMVCLMVCLSLTTMFAGCDKNPQKEGVSVNLLTRGWINLPTTDEDPYKKWLLDTYGLNVNLNATNDLGNAAQIAFNSLDKPDIVAFPELPSFSKIESQGVLLDDWTPFLEQMPNMKAFINSEEQKFLKQLFTDADGKLRALWTTPNATTWSLKIREDWANEYRATTVPGVGASGEANYYPAGNVATDGLPWQPKTDLDLLNFSRWIRMTKNTNPSAPDYFGFTTCGSGLDFGVLGDWLPMMWGYVGTPPYGIYVDPVTNKANFTAVDGTLQPMLDYMRVLTQEQLIDPNWFTQKPSDDQRTRAGKIGMTWYTSVISEMTANYNPTLDTTDWWKTYCIPKAEGSGAIGGSMLTDSVASSIITVSAKAAINSNKMTKICKLLDDIVCYYDSSKTGADKYVRGKAYDALKWGVGVDGDLAYKAIDNTDYLYLCVRTGNTYRETGKGNGAWDWGAWFSTSSDGVIQGDGKTISPIVLKTVEHDLVTGSFEKKLQVGSFLKLSQTDVNNMTKDLTKFKYDYITQKPGTLTIEQYKNRWNTTLKGQAILNESTEQFKKLGFIV